MSEGPPNFNPFESAGNSDSPEKKPSKSKKKSVESKPAKQEKAAALPEVSKEKKQGVLDKLFGKEVSSSENGHAVETKEDRTAKPEMTDKEATDALGRMVDARELEVGASELHGANADAAETAEAEADVKLLQQIKQEAAKEGATVAEALANAEQQTLEALGLAAAENTEHPEESASAEYESTDDEASEAARDVANETFIDPHEISEAEIPLTAEDDPESSQQGTSSHGSGSGSVPPHVPGGTSGSSGSPPGGGGSGTGGPRRPFVYPGYNPNLHNVPASGTTEYIYSESNALGAALLGGIVGYLLGKRRGRIKTEKRLVPVQKKLEREVRDIHTQLIDSEMRVRHLMAEKVRAGALRSADAHSAASSEKVTEKPSVVRGAPVPERQQPSKLETRLGLQKPAQAERLGKVLVRAEAAKRDEAIIELKNITPEHVRTMNRQELLALSEKVIVEGASLRQMYESHLIGERGLRRIITEHLEGRDVQKQLRREMVEREIDFERDPILRDKAYQEVSTRSASQPLQQLLQKAGINTEEDSTIPDIQRQERYEAAVRKAEKQRRMADSAMITVIIVLAALVAILFINR